MCDLALSGLSTGIVSDFKWFELSSMKNAGLGASPAKQFISLIINAYQAIRMKVSTSAQFLNQIFFSQKKTRYLNYFIFKPIHYEMKKTCNVNFHNDKPSSEYTSCPE